MFLIAHALYTCIPVWCLKVYLVIVTIVCFVFESVNLARLGDIVCRMVGYDLIAVRVTVETRGFGLERRLNLK